MRSKNFISQKWWIQKKRDWKFLKIQKNTGALKNTLFLLAGWDVGRWLWYHFYKNPFFDINCIVMACDIKNWWLVTFYGKKFDFLPKYHISYLCKIEPLFFTFISVNRWNLSSVYFRLSGKNQNTLTKIASFFKRKDYRKQKLQLP